MGLMTKNNSVISLFVPFFSYFFFCFFLFLQCEYILPG